MLDPAPVAPPSADVLVAALRMALGEAPLEDVLVTAFQPAGEGVGTATVATAALCAAVASRLAAGTVRARLRALPEAVLARALAQLAAD